jgi:outer membrane receptor protein involved in Fe transport
MSYIETERRALIFRRHLATKIGSVGLLLASPALALADAAHFDIPAQALPSALKAFATQADMQLLYEYDAVAKMQGNSILGHLDKRVALALLLRGTGLEATYSAADVATIKPVNRAKRAGSGDTSQVTPAGTSAMAAEKRSPARKSPVLEEIIVTSQKRPERMQNVPVPVAAVNASTLADKSQFRMQDYYMQVPGLALTPNQFSGAPSVAIRGITSGDATNPTVAITVDDVPFGSSTSIGGGYFAPDFDPSDLARVEVLRGPQGTLYGAAGVGGLIKYITIDPTTAELEGRVQGGVNSVHQGGKPGYNVSAGVNLPLSDGFAVRFSGFTREESGYVDNVRGVGERDVNETRSSGGHVSAIWWPSDLFSLKLSALVQESEILGAPYVTVQPGASDLEQDFLPATGSVERKFQAYSATAVANFDSVEFTSVTGYSESQLVDLLDYTALFGVFTQELFGAEGTLVTDDTTTYKFSQELRAAAQIGEHIDLLIGGYYTRESSPYTLEALAANPNGQPVGSMVVSSFSSTFREWASFTTLTYYFTERFDVQVGGRRSQITQSFEETDTGPLVPMVLGTTSPRVLPEEFAREHATTYLITPRFQASPDLMIYARFASGYRPGGINQGDLTGLPPRFAPDETLNYEVGIKGSAFDSRFSFDGSVYYIDWKDIQLSLVNPANGQNYFTNGSRAKSEGVELSMQLMPAEGLRIDGWAVWNNAVLTEAMPTPEEGGVNGPAGARLPFSSRFSAGASADYEFPLAGLTGVAGATISYVGNRLGTFISDESERQIFPAYTKVDVHAGMKTEQWTVDLYINNVTDKRGVLGGGNGTITPTAFQLVQPRTVGLSIARTF